MKRKIALVFESVILALSIVWIFENPITEAFITFTGSLSALVATLFFKGKKGNDYSGSTTILKDSNRNVIVNENHGNIQINSHSDELI